MMNSVIMTISALAVATAAYLAYWVLWCWAWHFAWPSGPQWFIRPTSEGFLIASITGLILLKSATI